MSPPNGTDAPPEYTKYRSRPKLFGRGGDAVEVAPGGLPPELPPQPGRRRWRRPSVRRVLVYLALALVGWVVLSGVLFLVSAQIEQGKVSADADAQLGGAGFPLTSPNNILVLGSDQRGAATAEPGSSTTAPGRSDSIMLLRIGGGSNARLSIARDTIADIPGHGRQKINAAYAFGGSALAIRTVEQFTGIDVNHIIEVNFDEFPGLIDAMGGINYTGGCVVSKVNGGYANGGVTVRIRAGVKTHLNGDQALALARTRKNACNPREDDRTRARRQQKLVAAMKAKVTSVETFVRLPWVAWAAPKALRSDMGGPTLLGLVGGALTGGTAHQQVLKASGGVTLPDGGAGLIVDEAQKQRQVATFLRG
jgi:LCP family protein required for cell wall assembly